MHRMKHTRYLHQIQKTRLKRDLKYRTFFKKNTHNYSLIASLISNMFNSFVLCPCKNLIGKLYN